MAANLKGSNNSDKIMKKLILLLTLLLFSADLFPQDDLSLWGETLFTSPQYLHFHTCGQYPPGEISWMVESPTLALEGRNLYENGRIKVEEFEAFSPCLDQHPELRALF